MKLSKKQHDIFKKILSAETDDFGYLARIAELDPRAHLRYADLTGVDFG